MALEYASRYRLSFVSKIDTGATRAGCAAEMRWHGAPAITGADHFPFREDLMVPSRFVDCYRLTGNSGQPVLARPILRTVDVKAPTMAVSGTCRQALPATADTGRTSSLDLMYAVIRARIGREDSGPGRQQARAHKVVELVVGRRQEEQGKSSRVAGGRHRQLQDAIAAIVKDLPRGVHLTAPEVYRKARESGLEVSLSTVYRTLNTLQAHGDVTAVAGEHGRRYEAREDGHDHDHLICLKCGLTVEFTDDLIRGFGRAVAERKGYDHLSSRFDIFGLCGECKAKDEDHRSGAFASRLASIVERMEQELDAMRAAVEWLEARKFARAKDMVGACTRRLSELMQSLEEILSDSDAEQE